jgi:hypothetical protein
MASAERQYTREMMKRFGGYYATWNPGVNLKLGDIGLLKNNVFTRISNLASLGVAFGIREDPTKLPLEYQSQGAVEVTTKVSGTAAPVGSVLANADAGVIVEFSKSHATLFRALGTSSPSIEDSIALETAILSLYGQGKWKSSWVVITELVSAESATIIISNSSSGKIELKATANVQAPSIDLADLSLGFSTQFAKGLETKIVATESLTPLFKVMGLKTKLFLSAELTTKHIAPMDLVTPDSSKSTHKGKLYLGYITSKTQQ